MEKKDPDQVGVVKVDLVLVFGAERGRMFEWNYISLGPFFGKTCPHRGGASDSSIIFKPSLSRCWWWIRSYEMLFF